MSGFASYGNYQQVTWSGIGTIDLNVQEISAASCSGTATTIPVVVIASPTVSFSSTSSSDCFTGADGSLNYTLAGLPVNWTSSVTGKRQLLVNISITCTNALYGGPIIYNNITVTETGAGTGTFNLSAPLNYYGLYTITLMAINDRISTKSKINGSVSGSTFVFLVSPIPTSRPMYHITNQ